MKDKRKFIAETLRMLAFYILAAVLVVLFSEKVLSWIRILWGGIVFLICLICSVWIYPVKD